MRTRHLLAPAIVLSVLPAQIFAPAQTQPLPPGFAGIAALAIGDIDADAVLDIVAVDQVGFFYGSVRVWYGDGSGHFVGGAPVQPPFTGPGRVALADLDGDSLLDVFAAGLPRVRLWPADGGGGFTEVPVPLERSACIGDFDGDGRPDLFGGIGATIGWLRNDGTGGFAALQPVQPLPPSANFAGFRAADFDGDGDTDVLAGWSVSAQLFLLRNDGVGGLTSEPLAVPFLVQALPFNFPGACDVFDFDGDGLPDLVSRGAGVGGFALHRNLGDGSFAATSSLTMPGVQDLQAADLDGDGIVDLVLCDGAGIQLLLGTGGGAFVPAQSVPVGANGRLALSDLDGDGGIDVVAIGPDGVHVLRNQQPRPTGVVAYGTGTATCHGRIGIRAVVEPTIGDQAFHVSCSNAPAYGAGLLALGTRVTNGWDPLGIDLRLHLGIAVPVATMPADGGGSARGRLPIPPLPFLAGLTVHLQSFWVADAGAGDTCSPAWAELASSHGLSLTLQP